MLMKVGAKEVNNWFSHYTYKSAQNKECRRSVHPPQQCSQNSPTHTQLVLMKNSSGDRFGVAQSMGPPTQYDSHTAINLPLRREQETRGPKHNSNRDLSGKSPQTPNPTVWEGFTLWAVFSGISYKRLRKSTLVNSTNKPSDDVPM